MQNNVYVSIQNLHAISLHLPKYVDGNKAIAVTTQQRENEKIKWVWLKQKNANGMIKMDLIHREK